jgi:hypothetical protein
MNFLFNTSKDFDDYFINEERCYRYLENFRWGKNVEFYNGNFHGITDILIICPHCNSKKPPYIVRTRSKLFYDLPYYRCSDRNCNLPFNVRTGTIFQGTQVLLKKWFKIIYEISKNGRNISSVELKLIGVTQKTAYSIQQILIQTNYKYFLTPNSQFEFISQTKKTVKKVLCTDEVKLEYKKILRKNRQLQSEIKKVTEKRVNAVLDYNILSKRFRQSEYQLNKITKELDKIKLEYNTNKQDSQVKNGQASKNEDADTSKDLVQDGIKTQPIKTYIPNTDGILLKLIDKYGCPNYIKKGNILLLNNSDYVYLYSISADKDICKVYKDNPNELLIIPTSQLSPLVK